MKMFLTVLSLCLGISFGYDLSCPDVSQWSIRARLLCPDPSKYYCLWDGNAKVFKENCSKVDLTRAGERLVIQYNFDSKFCPKHVYQPYPHFTNESSGCVYKKSTCNEEGQVVYDDTDTKHDIKCACDYTRGYDFITRPYNPCYCIPSEEDCSCYLNPCMVPELEYDSRCTNTTKLSNQNDCAPLTNSSEEDTQDTRPSMRIDEHAMESVSEFDRLYVQIAMVFLGCIIAVIGLSVFIVHKFKVKIDNTLNQYCRKAFVISKPPLDITCIEYSEFTLKCEISKSNLEVYWYKDDQRICNTKIIEQTLVGPLYSLAIKHMSEDDEGNYELRYKEKTLTKTYVLFQSFVISKPPLDITCIDYSEFTLKCEISKSNLEVYWYKDDQRICNTKNIEQNSDGPCHSLTIKHMSEDDKGQYELWYRGKTLTKTHVLFQSFVITKPALEITCIEDDEFTLKCEISISNLEKVNWYKNDTILPNTENIEQNLVGCLHSLTIKHMSEDDEGQYELRYREKTLTKTLVLFQLTDVISKPELEIICIEDNPFTLKCEISNSNLVVNWYKDDQCLSNSKNIEQNSEGPCHSLTIKHMSEDDKGQYELRYREQTLTKTLVLFQSIVITKPALDITCIEYSEFTLTCEISNSNLEVNWYKDNKFLNGTTKIEQSVVARLHSLTIKNMSEDDKGQYELRYGGKTLTKTLVRFQSIVIITPPLDITCIEYDEFTLKCEISSSKLEVYWCKNDKILPHTKKIEQKCDDSRLVGCLHSLTIKIMSKDDEGQYELRYREKTLTKTLVQLQFDENKKTEYLEIMKTKTEKRFYIRVMIVGEHGVGKSSLLRRLLGADRKGVQSTDGIDIVERRCKIRLRDGKWIFHGDQDLKRQYATRIKLALQQKKVGYEVAAMEMTTVDQKTSLGATQYRFSAHEEQEEVQITVTADNKPSGRLPQTFASEQKTHNTQEHEKPIQPTGSFTSTKKVKKVLIDEVEQELEDFLSHIEKYENENEVYVEIGFRDFAEQKECYGTHHAFLDSHALYLLVTDCSVDIKQSEPCVTYDSIDSYIDFWFDTIHNCRDVEEENNDKPLDPPIIAVCTGLDKITGQVNAKKNTYPQRLEDALRDGEKRNHLRDVCFVSNTNESGLDFDHVRKLIFDWGKKLQSFGKELPLKWIRLEQSLDVVREGGYIVIAREDVIDLAKKCDIHETEEVEQFLKHQHKIGSIIYCEDIKDYVILKQQWLADAFKCLVSDKIDNTIKSSNEWETLLKTGILEISLITKLFQKEQKLEFNKYKDYILQVLNKFDIVGIDFEQGKALYYMPYMIKPEFSPPLSEIVDHFEVPNAQCRKTTWLCYKFDFLPLPFFNYVMLYFIRRYKVCFDTKLNKRSIYHGVGVFFLDQTRAHKFIVLFCKNTVAFQIWNWDNFPRERYQTSLIMFQKVIDNLKMKYEAKNLIYWIETRHTQGDNNSKFGPMSDSDIQQGSNSEQYLFDEHNCKHDSSQLLDAWFYNYSNLPIRFPQRCQLCVSDPRPAVYWCTECVQAMCRECTTVHRTQPTSSTHTTVLLTRDYNFQIKGINIMDIASLCEGVLITIDYRDKQLITCDIRGQNKQFIPLPYYFPHRLSVIDQNNVAVTTYYDTKVLIVDVRQKNITKEFDIKKYCYGIMYRDNHLYVGCHDSLVKVDMSGEIIRTVPLSFTPFFCICSGTEGRIYCTDPYHNTVYCIDTEGNTVFTVTNTDMSGTSDITTDIDGHVLVVCDGSNNVHRISPDGKQCNVIIKDIPPRILRIPRICYDSISKSIVISRDDTIYIYKILPEK